MHQQQAPPAYPTSYNAIPPHQQPSQRPAYTSVYVGNPQFNGFDSKAIRSAFVSKVYGILSLQLFFATALIAIITFHQPVHEHVKENLLVYFLVGGLTGIAIMITFACNESARRSSPTNFILLMVLTVAYALMAGAFSVMYDTNTVLCAFGATALAVLTLMLVARFSPFDITDCGCALCILALVHVLVTLILNLTLVPAGYGHTGALIIAGTGAFLVSLYIIYDLQLIMGGRRNELSPEEYITGAAVLYCDIINLFTYLLMLFGARN